MIYIPLTLNPPIATKVACFSRLLKCLRRLFGKSVDPDQTSPIGAVCSGSTLFASILKLGSNVRQYLQQTTSADFIFQMHFFLGAFRVKFFACTVILHVFCRLLIFPKSISFLNTIRMSNSFGSISVPTKRRDRFGSKMFDKVTTDDKKQSGASALSYQINAQVTHSRRIDGDPKMMGIMCSSYGGRVC